MFYAFYPYETFKFLWPLSFGKDFPFWQTGGRKDPGYSELVGTLRLGGRDEVIGWWGEMLGRVGWGDWFVNCCDRLLGWDVRHGKIM